ncbi:MAG: hypothetical protein Q8P68_06190 [Candidatus Peregrinibacteria bacterium]|nr:hypothetical protein [Candidatus Peregrinibacteria bacterium]MDZ4245130.1 hypothetical protein [Candidatus Gracilibacteria bacterium]
MISKNLQHELFEADDSRRRLLYFSPAFDANAMDKHNRRITELEAVDTTTPTTLDQKEIDKLKEGIKELRVQLTELHNLLYKEGENGEQSDDKDDLATNHEYDTVDMDAIIYSDNKIHHDIDIDNLIAINFAEAVDTYKTAFDKLKTVEFDSPMDEWLPEGGDASDTIPEVGLSNLADLIKDGEVKPKEDTSTMLLYNAHGVKIEVPSMTSASFEIRKNKDVRKEGENHLIPIWYGGQKLYMNTKEGENHLIPIWYGGQELYMNTKDIAQPEVAQFTFKKVDGNNMYEVKSGDTILATVELEGMDIVNGGYDWEEIMTFAQAYEAAIESTEESPPEPTEEEAEEPTEEPEPEPEVEKVEATEEDVEEPEPETEVEKVKAAEEDVEEVGMAESPEETTTGETETPEPEPEVEKVEAAEEDVEEVGMAESPEETTTGETETPEPEPEVEKVEATEGDVEEPEPAPPLGVVPAGDIDNIYKLLSGGTQTEQIQGLQAMAIRLFRDSSYFDKLAGDDKILTINNEGTLYSVERIESNEADKLSKAIDDEIDRVLQELDAEKDSYKVNGTTDTLMKVSPTDLATIADAGGGTAYWKAQFQGLKGILENIPSGRKINMFTGNPELFVLFGDSIRKEVKRLAKKSEEDLKRTTYTISSTEMNKGPITVNNPTEAVIAVAKIAADKARASGDPKRMKMADAIMAGVPLLSISPEVVDYNGSAATQLVKKVEAREAEATEAETEGSGAESGEKVDLTPEAKRTIALNKIDIEKRVYKVGAPIMKSVFKKSSVEHLEAFFTAVTNMRGASGLKGKKPFKNSWREIFKTLLVNNRLEAPGDNIALLGRPLILFNMIRRAKEAQGTYGGNVPNNLTGDKWLYAMAENQYQKVSGDDSEVKNLPEVVSEKLEGPSGLETDLSDAQFPKGKSRGYRVHPTSSPNDFPFIFRISHNQDGTYDVHYGDGKMTSQNHSELMDRFVRRVLKRRLRDGRGNWDNFHSYRISSDGLSDPKMKEYYGRFMKNLPAEAVGRRVDARTASLLREISKESKLPLPSLKALLSRSHLELVDIVSVVLTGGKQKDLKGVKRLGKFELAAAKLYLKKVGSGEGENANAEPAIENLRGFARGLVEGERRAGVAALLEQEEKGGGNKKGKKGAEKIAAHRLSTIDKLQDLGLHDATARRAKQIYFKFAEALFKKGGRMSFRNQQFNRFDVLARNFEGGMDNNLGGQFGYMYGRAKIWKKKLINQGADLSGNKGAIILKDGRGGGNTVDDALLRMAAIAARAEWHPYNMSCAASNIAYGTSYGTPDRGEGMMAGRSSRRSPYQYN